MVTTEDGSQIEFNFCGELYPRQQCTDKQGKATLKDADGNCFNLGSNDDDNGHSFKRNDDSSGGDLSIIYDGGDIC